MVVLQADKERRLMLDLLRAHGASEADAAIVAEDLLEADLRGHDSHGLARFNMQLDALRQGRVDASATPAVVSDSAGAVTVDARRALGPPAMLFAVDEAVRRASGGQGVCAVTIRNHGYIAYLGWYVERGLEHDCICVLMSKARGGVHPYGGVLPLVGSNPITAAVPTAGEPLLIDMATSTAAMGKILAAQRTGEAIPSDWAVDEQGNPTTDANAARKGALSPLGGAKGYALGLLVEMLAAVLPGGSSGAARDALWSAVAIAVHVSAFGDPAEFRRRASAYLDELKSSPVAPGFSEILVPGQRAYRIRRERLAEGIPVSDETWRTIGGYLESAGLAAADYL
jgi:LDH2 family malate/lactate/ureidoglycolate dehydrogenase